jgi:hypothetical protein
MNVIGLKKDSDGVYTVTYFGAVVGWISRARLTATNERVWKALSVHGDVRNVRTLLQAQNALMACYH